MCRLVILLSFSLSLYGQTGYDFDRPLLIAELGNELDEISGLSVDPNQGGDLLAIEDESGKVYRLNARTGSLLWATDFWKDGDYEGVESVGADIWVVKSSGTLYHITKPGAPDQEVKKFNGPLTPDNDVEGLSYDPKGNRLLLACKRDADDDGNDKDGRYIFAFDLATNTFSQRPIYSIKRAAVTDFLKACQPTKKHGKLCQFFNDRKDYDLAPSSLAIHPRTGNLYLTSSVGKMLMILTPDGDIQHIQKLDKDLFPQPEGIAFAPDGTLYLSTERKKDHPARLYRLDYAK